MGTEIRLKANSKILLGQNQHYMKATELHGTKIVWSSKDDFPTTTNWSVHTKSENGSQFKHVKFNIQLTECAFGEMSPVAHHLTIRCGC